MARGRRRRATQAEREQRLAELCELLATCAPERSVARFAREKWGLGERAAEKYVAEARERLRAGAEIDRRAELGLALATYKLILRLQFKGGELGSARTTVDRVVRLLGLTLPTREPSITTAAIDAEIARLEAEIGELEEQTP